MTQVNLSGDAVTLEQDEATQTVTAAAASSCALEWADTS
jgi:hypothetical protein